MLNAELHGDEHDGADEDLVRISRVDARLEDVVDQRARVEDQTGVHGRDGHDQRPSVDPPHPPSVARSDQMLSPLEQRAGDGIVAAELGKDERHKELAQHDDGQQPEVSRSRGADPQDEQRVDADNRRDVAEGDREVLEEVEDTPQLLPVPKARQLRGITVSGFRLRDKGTTAHLRFLHPSPPTRAACGRKYRSAARGCARGLRR